MTDRRSAREEDRLLPRQLRESAATVTDWTATPWTVAREDEPVPGGPARHTPAGWLLDGPGWPWLAGLLDLLAMCGALTAALAITPDGHAPLGALAAFPAVGVPGLALARSRARRMDAGVLDDLWPLVASVSLAGMLATALGEVAGGGRGSAGLVVAWAAAIGLLTTTHVAARLARRVLRVRGLAGRPTIIVGAGPVGVRIARRLDSRPQYGLRPVGIVDWRPLPAEAVGGRPVPVLGEPGELARLVRRLGAQHVVLAFPGRPDHALGPLLRTCGELGVDVSIVPRLFEHTNDRMTYDAVGGLPLLGLSAARQGGGRIATKHVLDKVGASVLLVVAAPLMALIALSIAVTTRGPVIFRQRRLGRDGKEFHLLKFCTMRAGTPADPAGAADLDADEAPGGVEGTDRRTAIGRLLRRTSLDELAQLVNVLRGDMSLVGPRPERPEYVELFSDQLDRYGDRHRMRPGITGLAQVKGLRGQTSLVERVELDNFYIEHWSFTLDAKILARTLIAAFYVPE